MKNILISLSIFTIISLASYQNAAAQCGQLDSLYRVLRVAKLDIDKVNTLNALADELSAMGRDGQAAFYTKQALRLAENAGYDKGIADALTRVALLDYKDLGRLSKSIDDFKKAQAIYEELGDQAQRVRTLGIIANFYFKAFDDESYKVAIEYFKQVVEIQQELKQEKQAAEALESLGTLYGRLNKDKEALEAFEQAHEIKTKLGISTATNERILEKYRRLNQLEDHISHSDTVRLSTGFGIVIAVLLILVITFWVQRNRALYLLKQHKPELLVRKPQVLDMDLVQ